MFLRYLLTMLFCICDIRTLGIVDIVSTTRSKNKDKYLTQAWQLYSNKYFWALPLVMHLYHYNVIFFKNYLMLILG